MKKLQVLGVFLKIRNFQLVDSNQEFRQYVNNANYLFLLVRQNWKLYEDFQNVKILVLSVLKVESNQKTPKHTPE